MARYRLAVEQWEAEGCPLTSLGGSTGRVVIPHPLFLIVQQTEAQAARLAKDLEAKHRGPDPVAKVGKSIGKSPAAKLREKS
jgi:hypothetical protein